MSEPTSTEVPSDHLALVRGCYNAAKRGARDGLVSGMMLVLILGGVVEVARFVIERYRKA